jgi:hypothetical protein
VEAPAQPSADGQVVTSMALNRCFSSDAWTSMSLQRSKPIAGGH